MTKAVVFIASIFVIPILSVIGKWMSDAVTENYTFASTVTNLTMFPWLVPYARSLWWIIPIAAVIMLFIYMMRPAEPEMPQFPSFRPPRIPRAPKPTKKQLRQMKKQQPPPSIFLGR
jgi:hypothetical protein